MRKFLVLAASVCLAALVTAGCGYQLRGVGRPVGVSIGSMAIPVLEAPSTDLGFEADLTRMIREEFLRQTRIPLVPRDRADAVFRGRVRKINLKPQSYTLSETDVGGHVSTYETTASRWLEVVLDAEVIHRGTGEILWREKGMRERAAYAVDADPLRTRYNRREALRAIGRSLAGKIYTRTLERF